MRSKTILISMESKIMVKAKMCVYCREQKTLDNFCKNKRSKDGLHNICRVCASAYHKTYRENHKKDLAQYYKEWKRKNKEKLKEYKHQYYQENKDKIYAHKDLLMQDEEYVRRYLVRKRKQSRKYRQEHKEEIRNSTRKYRKNNPEKYRAHQLVLYAMRRGTLLRQPCEKCGAEKAEAHHDDYSKPLDVRWLCHSCHIKWHKEINILDNNVNVKGE